MGAGKGKLSIVAFDLARTGGTRVLVEIADGLIARGHEVTFVIPAGAARGFATAAPVLEVGPGWLARLSRGKNLASLPFLARQWANADAVLATYYPTALAVWWRTRFSPGRRGYYFIQGYEPWFAEGKLAPVKGWVARATYRLPLRCLVNSRWLGDLAVPGGPAGYDLVTPGVDTAVFHPTRSDRAEPPLMIGAIARRGWVKGFDTLVDALALLWSRRQDFRVLLAMPEPIPFSLAAPCDLVRPQSDAEMCAFYHRLSVFAFSSRAEGFGLPPLEAMACGVPVITTDCGGVREFAAPGGNSLVVPPGDPAALAEGLDQLLSNQEMRRQFAAAGLETARQFTWGRTVDAAERALFGESGRAP
ncbi:MAG: glycosyltransferase family 4 protein [Chloroflexi bacterium]|nr:glycosyltransferase family 4 protein [Chloroflexota bacterium]